jgi:hypothetical protein
VQSQLVWEGNIGSVPLRVEVPHAGRILAQWELPSGRREKVSKTVDEFERSVLFQIIVASGKTDTDAVQEVLGAVITAEAERPAPKRTEAQPQRRKPKVRRHRRSRTPPRRR